MAALTHTHPQLSNVHQLGVERGAVDVVQGLRRHARCAFEDKGRVALAHVAAKAAVDVDDRQLAAVGVVAVTCNRRQTGSDAWFFSEAATLGFLPWYPLVCVRACVRACVRVCVGWWWWVGGLCIYYLSPPPPPRPAPFPRLSSSPLTPVFTQGVGEGGQPLCQLVVVAAGRRGREGGWWRHWRGHCQARGQAVPSAAWAAHPVPSLPLPGAVPWGEGWRRTHLPRAGPVPREQLSACDLGNTLRAARGDQGGQAGRTDHGGHSCGQEVGSSSRERPS